MSDGCFHLGGYEHDLLDSMELPISICDPDESLAGWPFRKPKDEPEPSEAERVLGRPIYLETRRRDIAEMKRARNRRDGK